MVMDYIGIILLACFVAFVILGPVSCMIHARRREHQKYHPKPKAFQKARHKLGAVTQCREQGEKCNTDDEAWIGDCPICMGPLCPSMTQDTTVEKGTSVSVTPAIVSSASCYPGMAAEPPSRADGQRSVEPAPPEGAVAGPAHQQPSTREDPSTSKELPETAMESEEAIEGSRREDEQGKTTVELVQKTGATTLTPINRDTEVLKLKSCGHMFHSQCLLTWFLTERYDCPVCRTKYWNGTPSRHWFGDGRLSYTTPVSRMTVGNVV